MRARWLPYPLLSLFLLFMWLLLTQSFSPGQFVLGSIVTVMASWFMALLEPERVRVRFTRAIPRLILIVLGDILRSNIGVGQIVFRRDCASTSGFITVPLDLKNRYGLAVLSMIVTSTPGTLWIQHDSSRHVLLLHVLDLVDENYWIDLIKSRYERLLMEIFE
jgi:multicomponent K+:H+ antiporter subunit E